LVTILKIALPKKRAGRFYQPRVFWAFLIQS
jgi:hypothetical protein